MSIIPQERHNMSMATLSTHKMSKHFIQGTEKVIVLSEIDSVFRQEKSYAITGISGSGKSTFMHLIAGIDTPTSGTVAFNGISLSMLNPNDFNQFLNQSIGLVFQSPHLLKELSVIENIMLPGLIRGATRLECRAKAQNLLQKVGVLEKENSKVGELSGGQQQRIAIARALFNEPAFLIADEPTGNLDIATGKSIIDLLISCHQEQHMGLIISSHDNYVTEKMSTIYHLDNRTLYKL